MKDKTPVIMVGYPDVLLLDIAGPIQVYSTANKLLSKPHYEVHLVSASGEAIETEAGLVMQVSGALSNALSWGGFDYSRRARVLIDCWKIKVF